MPDGFEYFSYFRWWRMGLATSMAFVLFLVTLAATVVQLKLQGGRR